MRFHFKSFAMVTMLVGSFTACCSAVNALEISAKSTAGILTAITDKKLINDKGHIILKSDGKIEGVSDGKLVTGDWSEKDGFYCRSMAVGDGRVDTDCQIILNTDEGLIFHRHKGAGRKVGPYKAQ
ncbi:MAG: hypothetical protein COC24_009455 [Alphaproteobacteria bacterium]|nr:hypothetical protein [Alphaproteobacteria bacterium]